MPNYDGRWEVRIGYTTLVSSVPMSHRHTFDVNIHGLPVAGDEVDDITCITKGGEEVVLTTAVSEYVERWTPLFAETSTFDTFELWKYEPEPSSDAVFINAAILGVFGTYDGATNPAQQLTLTFRSLSGGIARLQMMEIVTNSRIKDPYPFANADLLALGMWAVGDDSIITARDNAYLNVPLNACYGENERLAKKRFRPF